LPRLADTGRALLVGQPARGHDHPAHGSRLLDRLLPGAARAELGGRCDHAAHRSAPVADRLPAALGHQGVLGDVGDDQDRCLGPAPGAVHRDGAAGWADARSQHAAALLRSPRVHTARAHRRPHVHPLPADPGAGHLGASVGGEDMSDDVRSDSATTTPAVPPTLTLPRSGVPTKPASWGGKGGGDSSDDGILAAQWDGYLRPGPGAVTAVPIVEVGNEEQVLEPEYKWVPIGPDHILYPVLVGLALFPMFFGAAGRHLAEDLPEDETHPFFP